LAATIRDVARGANVSVATVSRALNEHPNVSPQTRERVQAVALELGFIASGAARSLITRRTQTIGVLLPDVYGEFFSELIRGIDGAARRHGLHLLLSGSHGDRAEAAAAIKAMSGRVDGLLIMSPHLDARALADNLPRGWPVVLMNTRGEGVQAACLTVDNYGGAYAMVRHLAGLGHRSIVFIGGPEANFEAQERLRGYREALAQLLPGSEPLVLPGEFTEESGWRVGNRILAMQPRPGAIFAANDAMAIGCLFCLGEAGVQVPHDVALVGFDDIPLARFVNPPLTTVRVRIAELGSMALERLALSIETKNFASIKPQTLRSELVVRTSCGGAQEGAASVASPKLR